MEKKYNMRSPAVKRLMREAIELKDPTPMYFAQPLEDNLFEWHFTIQGPQGTEFEEGFYHGRILLPSEYPMRPPSIIMLTPNGRFELHQKICLSASSYHPELWQPSWSIRTVLLAIIGFMPTEGVGAIGSMDCPPEERRRMAQRSLQWTCPSCGVPNRDILPRAEGGGADEQTMAEAANIVTQMAFKSEAEVRQQKATIEQRSQKPADSSNQLQDHSDKQLREDPQEAVTETPHEQTDPELRRRVVSPPAVGERTVSPSGHTERTRGWVSLVLIWCLLLAVAALIARRVFLM